jgi:hypothetical protein
MARAVSFVAWCCSIRFPSYEAYQYAVRVGSAFDLD